MNPCCPHPESEHCKGGVLHARVKNQYARPIRCIGRHCEAPLCCCTAFREARKAPGRVIPIDILRDATGTIPAALYSPFSIR
jgi:hypothetical protein